MVIVIPDIIIEQDINRLTNQLWKLIPMRENQENWVGQLSSLIIEIIGLAHLSSNIDEKFLILVSKLKGLEIEETNFQTYRKTVFECISLLRVMRL